MKRTATIFAAIALIALVLFACGQQEQPSAPPPPPPPAAAPKPAPATLESVAVQPGEVELKAGDTASLSMSAAFSDKSTKDVTAQAQWTSSDAKVAEVAAGTVTAKTAGTATITATAEGKSATVTVKVAKKAATPKAAAPATSAYQAPKAKVEKKTPAPDHSAHHMDKTAPAAPAKTFVASAPPAPPAPPTPTPTPTAATAASSPAATQAPSAAAAFYAGKGQGWNAYVKADGSSVLNASGADCPRDASAQCIHAGAMRKFDLPGATSCQGVTAQDGLDAFNWLCIESAGQVSVVSTGLKAGKGLSDLIDFDRAQWLPNAVRITTNLGDKAQTYSTGAAKWWSDGIVVNNSGAPIAAGSINIKNDSTPATYKTNALASTLLVKPGIALKGTGTGRAVVDATGADGFAFEGAIDATGYEVGLLVAKSTWASARHAQVTGASSAGISAFGVKNASFANLNLIANNIGLYVEDAKGLAANDVTTSGNAFVGAFFHHVTASALARMQAHDNGYAGIKVAASSDLSAMQIQASGNKGIGLFLWRITDCKFATMVFNNDREAGVVLLNSTGSSFEDLSTSSCRTGMYLADSSRNAVLRAKLANGDFGVIALESADNSFTATNTDLNKKRGILRVKRKDK